MCALAARVAGCWIGSAKQKAKYLGIQGMERESIRRGKERERPVSVGRLGS